MAPALIDRLRFHTPADKDRATQIIAERMGTDSDVDIGPGLLVQLSFAAADFAFQQWVRQSGSRRPLDRYVTEALERVKSPRWVGRRASLR
jgi:MftR C-terminal domain